jgi:hypothetical protein
VLGAWHDQGSCLSWQPQGFKLEELPRTAAPSGSAASDPAP